MQHFTIKLNLCLGLLLMAGCDQAGRGPTVTPVASPTVLPADTAPAPTPSPGTAPNTPTSGQTHADPAYGFTLTYPAQWEICQTTEHSRLFCLTQTEPRGPGFPVFYVSIIPAGFTNPDASVYNFIAEEKLRDVWALVTISKPKNSCKELRFLAEKSMPKSVLR